jgi:hypothetical protein
MCCYVKNANGIERRSVRLGRCSDENVEICEGLSEGDEVVVTPKRADR